MVLVFPFWPWWWRVRQWSMISIARLPEHRSLRFRVTASRVSVIPRCCLWKEPRTRNAPGKCYPLQGQVTHPCANVGQASGA